MGGALGRIRQSSTLTVSSYECGSPPGFEPPDTSNSAPELYGRRQRMLLDHSPRVLVILAVKIDGLCKVPVTTDEVEPIVHCAAIAPRLSGEIRNFTFPGNRLSPSRHYEHRNDKILGRLNSGAPLLGSSAASDGDSVFNRNGR